MKRVSRSFALSTIHEGVSYSVVWTDLNGTITNIPCYSNGVGKTVPNGYGSTPWVTAMLYKSVGDSAPQPCEAETIIMKAYDINGKEITGSSFSTKTESSFYDIQKYYYDHSQEVRYVVEFLNANRNTLASSSICRTLDGTNGADGFNTPSYIVDKYGWSNEASTNSIYTCPTDLLPPETHFSLSIPAQNGRAYLWKQTVRMTLVANSSPARYDAGEAEYYRLTGERGTTISVKGQAAAVVIGRYQGTSNLPSSGVSVGDYAFVYGVVDDYYLYKYVSSGGSNSWQRQDYIFQNGDIVIIKDDDQLWRFSIDDIQQDVSAQSDGSAYTSLLDGHLWQWSAEGLAWLDLGQFKGESGKSQYTHIAWATDVSTDTIGNLLVQGFTTTKAYNDTTHLWMGVYVDENEGQDPQNATLYTWSYTKGNKGDDGNRGRIGRFYYYGGVFNRNDSTTLFKVNDTEVPFFQDPDIDPNVNRKEYYVYNPSTNPSNNEITMSQMWSNSQSSFNNAPWEAIFNDFKYIISEAIFSNYAHLGSFIINGDWMISQQGVDNKQNPSNPTYLDFTPLNDGTFDPTKFVPSLAFNAMTGETWIGDAHINGEVNATSGTFRGAIQAQSGSVGGFTIGANSLQNTSATRGAVVKISDSSNSYHSEIGGCSVPSGENNPLRGARMSSLFKANEEDTKNVAVGAIAKGGGAALNFALLGEGHIVTNGGIWGIALSKQTISGVSYLSLADGATILLSGSGNAILPSLSNVRSWLSIPDTQPFAVQIKLLFKNSITLYGYNSTYTSAPHLRDNDYDDEEYFDVGAGRVLTLMLVWDGESGHSHYNAWTVGYSEYFD